MSKCKQLDFDFHQQLNILVPLLSKDKKVKSAFQHLRQQQPNAKERHLWHDAILNTYTPHSLFKRAELYPALFCYDGEGATIMPKKVISNTDHVVVASAVLHERKETRQVVVKLYCSSSRDTEYEMSIYRELKEKNCPVPWFSTKFKFFDAPVLVLERLKPVEGCDNEFVVASHVLQQLLILHMFAVHCDIKPQNIMRHPKKGYYYLIDYGGVAKERLGPGYRRWVWSPRYTSQTRRRRKQVTTPRHDLIELGYTMQAIENLREDKKDITVRSNFNDRIARYMVAAHDIKPILHLPVKVYRDLNHILMCREPSKCRECTKLSKLASRFNRNGIRT